MKTTLLSLTVLMASSLSLLAAEKPAQKSPNPSKKNVTFEYRFDDSLQQTPDSIARKEQWFYDAKFGAFIHFGVYSVLEGAYQGRVPRPRYAEWIQVNAKMSADEYHEVAKGFNPVDFDAEEWVKVNGESIYGTRRNPLPNRPEWGDCTVSKDGKTLYLHILKWPESGTVSVEGLESKATSARFLANGEKADFMQDGNTLKITLPAKPLNQYDTVVKVLF